MIKYHSRSDNKILVNNISGVLVNRPGILARKTCKGRYED
jgi:hypothetical protein